ncbi:Beta-lactamase-like protein [Niveomyces insectorum RCEF 264]|uniref:Beta-lactamase-like protein n=1 Tax=Niveomyces insectorum RCEF 264 TaxID=1081102 RepID=A0A162JYG9_9HYPO|nr:Beta-lactamase-like protein [Niveomyces insectorum RCEF 264]
MSSQIQFPPGNVAKVSIIDSTLGVNDMNTTYLMDPPMKGFEKLRTIPTWSFFVESSNGKKALFDLGVPPDINTFSPAVVAKLKASGWRIESKKHVADTLKENGVDLKTINSVIWSHWHWDHIGDTTTFPASTELVVGPGFKDAFFPGFPGKADSPVREADWSGRHLNEIDFSDGLRIGKFRAVDFFGDGSFYLLDTPGHAIGHLGALARTTSEPDSFIMMGGDLCHHGAEIRPSPLLPLPATIPEASAAVIRAQWPACPGGEAFTKLNTKRNRKPNEPFFYPAIGADIPLAIKTIQDAQLTDAQENVYFIFAHDRSIRGVVDLYPKSANDWLKNGWREKTLWSFLVDFNNALAQY